MFTITIDGPSASGKSTVADIVSEKLNMHHLNSGDFYRAIALYFLKKNIHYEDSEAIKKELPKIKIFIKYIDDEQHDFLNGEDVTHLLHSNEINDVVSKFGHNLDVVDKASKLTYLATTTENLVIDGRNVGSYVIPDAECKIYLDCDAKIRAERRYKEALEKGSNVTFEEILKQTIERDELDKKRVIAPLVVPKNAYKIKSDDKSPEDVANEIIKIVQKL